MKKTSKNKVETPFGKVSVSKTEKKKVITVKEVEKPKTVVKNVYNPDFKLVDDTIEEIKKVSRKVAVNDYSANNIYLILQDALKKVVLADK